MHILAEKNRFKNQNSFTFIQMNSALCCPTRGHYLRLAFPLIKCSTRRNFFAYRVIKPWNSLPPLVVNAKSAQSFKSRHSSVDLSIYLKYPFISIHWLHEYLSYPSWPIHCVYIVSLIRVINFSFPLISSDEIKCPFFNVVYFQYFIDFNDFRCYFFVHDCILSSQFNTALMQTNYYKDHF